MNRPATMYALVRAASAFVYTLTRRPPAAVPVAAPVIVPEAPHVPLSAGLPPRAGVANSCPVCQARFRGARTCSRCGADLEPLMLLSVKAWRLRQASRQALDDGDVNGALEFANEAQAVQSTGSGEALRLLASWWNTAHAPSAADLRPR